MKNTKIVATIGPASESKEVLRQMAEAGMNVVRLNFSHGAHEWHGMVINRVRELSEELGRPIGILADLQGPRIRTETASDIPLSKGDRILVSDVSERARCLFGPSRPGFYLDAPGSSGDMHVGDKILIEDGLIGLHVVAKHPDCVEAVAETDGVVKSRKGVILPDTKLSLPILSEKDLKDLHFVLKEDVDFVALSFVGSARHIEQARAAMRSFLGEEAPLPKIVAKIERKEAIKHLKSIVKATDAVMVARGDLGIEMPEAEVAILQKEIIAESLKGVKPVIVATQMMKSMVENARPTRAEVSDVSNAVIDHCDAVMLSEESAMGKYPVETVSMMSEIISRTEESPFDDVYEAIATNLRSDYAVMIRSVYELAKSFRAKAILALSMSGFTARLLSHFRPETRIIVATDNRRTYRELSLVWGVVPYCFEEDKEYDRYIDRLMREAKAGDLISSGDDVAVFLGRTKDRRTLDLVGIRRVR